MLTQCEAIFVVGLIGFAGIPALALAFPFAFITSRLLRAKVRAGMIATAGAGSSFAGDSPRRQSIGKLEVDNIGVRDVDHARGTRRPSIEAKRLTRRRASAYAVAALPQTMLIACWLIFQLNVESAGTAVVVFILLFLLTATPLVVTTSAAHSRRSLRYITFLFVLSIVAGVLIPVLGAILVLWAFSVGIITAFVIALLSRPFRAVGPAALSSSFIFVLTVSTSVASAIVYQSAKHGHDLVADLCEGAYEGYSIGAFNPEYQPRLEAFTSELAAKVSPLPSMLVIFFIVTGIVLALWYLRARAYAFSRRQASDNMLTADAVMLIFSFWLALWLFFAPIDRGWIGSLLAILGFILYRWLARKLLRAWMPANADPRPLLFLRVFNKDRRTQHVVNEFGPLARQFGPIMFVAGTDLLASTVNRQQFYDFLVGRFRNAFVKDEKSLQAKLSERYQQADPDGLFRTTEFFCHDDTWRLAVRRLASEARAVLMDLRSFSTANQGCVVEIRELMDTVPVSNIVFLVDDETDLELLAVTLSDAWSNLRADSPNASAGTHTIRLLTTSRRVGKTYNALLDMLFAKTQAATLA